VTAGNADAARKHVERARELAAAVMDDDERGLLEADLATIRT
jgi:hypothetical protein